MPSSVQATHISFYSIVPFVPFPTETGQPKDPMDRQFLVQELNITEDQTASPSM